MICPIMNIGRTDQSASCVKENCSFYIATPDGKDGACAIRAMAEVQIDLIAMLYKSSPERGANGEKTIIRK